LRKALLKHLIGLYPLASGEVLIGSENLATAEGSDRERILRRFRVTYGAERFQVNDVKRKRDAAH
jgi:hypothetical protein